MKVLIADDDRVTQELLRAHLTRWGYIVEVAEDGAQALESLQSPDGPQLALLDWMMPGMDGPAVCRAVREVAERPYRYLIVVTSKDHKADVVEGLDSGADDYITKPVALPELQARLRAARRILELQAQLIETQERLRVEATHDALTGLRNRRALMDKLTSEVARSRRDGRPLSVVMGDLDKFKAINDRYGHAGGDAVLKEVARRLLLAVRQYDGVGRYGGEELAIVLPNCEADVACQIAQRIGDRIRSEPVMFGDVSIPVTISLGVATCTTSCCDPHALMKRADDALYVAKRGGRDRVEAAPGESDPSASAAGQAAVTRS